MHVVHGQDHDQEQLKLPHGNPVVRLPRELLGQRPSTSLHQRQALDTTVELH